MENMDYSLKAEMHVHSNTDKLFCLPFLYDSVQSVEVIINRAFHLGIKIISITDHNSLNGYKLCKNIIKKLDLDMILIPGCEISTKGGHVLAYNIKNQIKSFMSAEETIEEIHKQSGIAIAAHPYNFNSIKNGVFNLDFDAIEAYNSKSFLWMNKMARKAAEKLNLPCTAGSDAHQIENIGNAMMLFPKNTETSDDVINNIISGNFKIKFKRTRFFPMILNHIYKNFSNFKENSNQSPAFR